MAELKRNVTDTVYDQILKLIVQGEIKEGDRIQSENELKDTFGVSRNTIRTVLNRLNVLGVLETRRGEGTFVKRIGNDVHLNTFIPAILINSNDLMGLLEFRKGIEVASARLAAVNATPEGLIELEKCLHSVEKEEIDNHEFAQSTIDFHLQIAILSKNEMFIKLLELIKYILTSKMERFLYFEPNATDSTYYHEMIYNCIKAGKPEEAAYMMDRHMVLLLDRIDDYRVYIQNNPDDEAIPQTTTMKVHERKDII